MKWLYSGEYVSVPCFRFRGSNGTRLAYCVLLLLFTSLSACLLSRHVTNYMLNYVDLENKCMDLSEFIVEKTQFQVKFSDDFLFNFI